jgi:glycosyltransferase involved in cell wall biosynthesis
LHKRFVAQAEIAQLHAQHGVLLSPTRMDAQGVSRDEAMSSGLVPITNAVAAVPEFVDEACGLVMPGEDPAQLAQAIRQLHDDPAQFLALSRAAAARVRRQSGFEQTIGRELALLSP